MAEEISFLDDEIVRLCDEIAKELAQVVKPKSKLKITKREEMVEEMLEKISKGKNLYHLYLSQLKEVIKEADRKTYTEYKEKGHRHHKALTDLTQDVKLAQQNIAQEERPPAERDRKNINTWAADEIIEEGKRVQGHSNESLARSQRLVESAEAIATDTNIALHRQTEQMKSTNADVEGVAENLNRADKVIAHIARRLATDKMIMCLILLLILAILGIILAKSLKLLPGDKASEEEIDCSLDLTQTTKQCLEARAAEANGRRRSMVGEFQDPWSTGLLWGLGSIVRGVWPSDQVGLEHGLGPGRRRNEPVGTADAVERWVAPVPSPEPSQSNTLARQPSPSGNLYVGWVSMEPETSKRMRQQTLQLHVEAELSGPQGRWL
mmetsp:Transcript_24727/g.50172  ORF Transcript_24727/g.50172 Transcript_24727/m.50172 type:complete len:380 (+) Transcript_24727:75-1214(+)